MNYDEIFANDIERKFFYTDYAGSKMMVGRISLKNAKARLDKNELYTLVTYSNGEELPNQYVPISLESEDGTLFATFNPNIRRFNYICQDGGIQIVSRLMDLENGSPNYLLGPGPETISLDEIITEQYHQYLEEHGLSSRKSR